VELIIVITVVAILAGGLFVASKPQKRIGETNDAKRKNDAQAIEQAIKVVATDSGVMPTELKGLTENEYFAIVKAGGSVIGTYSCTALGTSLVKKDISASLLSVIPQMPIDPELTSASNETGYYIVRRGSSYDVEPCNTYRLAATSGTKQMCGDGYCGTTESCASCSQDCGDCPAQQYSVDRYSNTVTDAGGSFAWTNPNNVKLDDGTQAYNLPTPPSTNFSDNVVSIIKADGSIGLANNKDVSAWPPSWEVSTYGDSANKWSETWTPADIRDSDFGVALNIINLEETVSNTLKVTNFGFTELEIPDGATIDGIIVYIEKRNRTTTRAPIASYGDVDVIHIKVYLTY
jgi:hypothetical protein